MLPPNLGVCPVSVSVMKSISLNSFTHRITGFEPPNQILEELLQFFRQKGFRGDAPPSTGGHLGGNRGTPVKPV
ncbi:hypothetical protein O77CONTIG1_04413 [Leptolyngbya sp. O-77]|nr:hypothetical protein O77CONTIG1_04413 [Leptolyngbya sp. O-77]